MSGPLGRLFQLTPLAPTFGARVGSVRLVFLFVVVGSASAVFAWAMPRQDARAEARAARLEKTEATIRQAESRYVERRIGRRSSETGYEVTLRYDFDARGRVVTGSAFTFSEREARVSTEEEAESLLKRYPVGAKLPVWYDRDHPSDCALDPVYIPVTAYVIPAAAVSVVSFVATIAFARQRLREVRLGPPLPAAERRKGHLLGLVVAAVPALILAFHLGGWGLHLVRLTRLTEATVYLTGDLEVSYGPPTPQVRYFFRALPGETRVWEGSAWRFGRASVSSDEEAEAIVKRLGEEYQASTLAVYFVRGNPATNALTTGYGGVLETWAVLALTGVLALGLWLAAAYRAEAGERPRVRWGRHS
jgi:hypothetical protein